MNKIVTLGELLIDFLHTGQSDTGALLFEQNPGGAPANVACGLSRLGASSAFIGKVGRDMHGDFLRRVLEEEGVDTSGLVSDEDVFTTLAFVKRDGAERSFSFARKPGADTCLRQEEIDQELIKKADIFHFGSLSLTNEPSKSATLYSVKLAKSSGSIISYDPNYRAPLWPSEDIAAEGMRRPLEMVDIIKISDEETELLSGEKEPRKAADRLISGGIKLVCVTLGSKGAFIKNKNYEVEVPGREVAAVDTTGAGDSFWSAFLFKLTCSGKSPEALTSDELMEYGSFACAAASITVTRKGAIRAMPTLHEVLEACKTV